MTSTFKNGPQFRRKPFFAQTLLLYVVPIHAHKKTLFQISNAAIIILFLVSETFTYLWRKTEHLNFKSRAIGSRRSLNKLKYYFKGEL